MNKLKFSLGIEPYLNLIHLTCRNSLMNILSFVLCVCQWDSKYKEQYWGQHWEQTRTNSKTTSCRTPSKPSTRSMTTTLGLNSMILCWKLLESLKSKLGTSLGSLRMN